MSFEKNPISLSAVVGKSPGELVADTTQLEYESDPKLKALSFNTIKRVGF